MAYRPLKTTDFSDQLALWAEAAPQHSEAKPPHAPSLPEIDRRRGDTAYTPSPAVTRPVAARRADTVSRSERALVAIRGMLAKGGAVPAREARRCDPGVEHIEPSISRMVFPADDAGSLAKGGAVPAREARRCDPGVEHIEPSISRMVFPADDAGSLAKGGAVPDREPRN